MKVNTKVTAELNARLFALQLEMLGSDNLIFFKDMQVLIEKYEMPTEIAQAFTVGKVFRHRDSSCVPQYHGDSFKTWMVQPSAGKKVALDFAQCASMKEYVLPKNMQDTSIQDAAKSVPMDEQQFWLALYALIIEPKLGKQYFHYELSKSKYYIFHVKLDSGEIVAVDVYWDGDEWYCLANRFDDDFAWGRGSVFLDLATAES